MKAIIAVFFMLALAAASAQTPAQYSSELGNGFVMADGAVVKQGDAAFPSVVEKFIKQQLEAAKDAKRVDYKDGPSFMSKDIMYVFKQMPRGCVCMSGMERGKYFTIKYWTIMIAPNDKRMAGAYALIKGA